MVEAMKPLQLLRRDIKTDIRTESEAIQDLVNIKIGGVQKQLDELKTEKASTAEVEDLRWENIRLHDNVDAMLNLLDKQANQITNMCYSTAQAQAHASHDMLSISGLPDDPAIALEQSFVDFL